MGGWRFSRCRKCIRQAAAALDGLAMLDETQHNLLPELFAEGSELPLADRLAFVQRACCGDLELQRELADLLEIEGRTLAGFLAEPALALSLPRLSPESQVPFERPSSWPIAPDDGCKQS